MLTSRAIKVAVALDLGLTKDQVDKACEDYGLVGSAEYTQDKKAAVNAAAASLLETYLLLKSESEGGFSVSINTDQVIARIRSLAGLSGGLYPLPEEFKPAKTRVRAVNRW